MRRLLCTRCDIVAVRHTVPSAKALTRTNSISVFALSTYFYTPSGRRTKIFAGDPPIPLMRERLAQVFELELASFVFVKIEIVKFP